MCNTTKLTIHHFGPVQDVNLTFSKYTVLVGAQGTGKSTVAKVFSMFTWLEKTLLMGIYTTDYITKYKRFRKNVFGFHRIFSYFKDDTVLEYTGMYYRFLYENEHFTVSRFREAETYELPKVMYVPAERNLLSTMEHGLKRSALRYIPEALISLDEEYNAAKKHYRRGMCLPINGTHFEYDLLNRKSWIVGDDYRTPVEETSSGFQSVLPLTLVSHHLADIVSKKNEDGAARETVSPQLAKGVKQLINDTTLSEEMLHIALRTLSSRFSCSYFVNIVEEMELNLFPSSQRGVLFDLIACANTSEQNRLVLTTHSPYVIDYITLAAKAAQVDAVTNGEEREQLSQIVPTDSMVNADDLSIYELSDGKAREIGMISGVPSDSNALNIHLEDTNTMFDILMDIEQSR